MDTARDSITKKVTSSVASRFIWSKAVLTLENSLQDVVEEEL